MVYEAVYIDLLISVASISYLKNCYFPVGNFCPPNLTRGRVELMAKMSI